MDTALINQLFYANAYVHPPGYTVPPHLHHYHQLDVVLSGRFAARVEERRTTMLTTGHGYLTPPLVRHAYRALTPVRHVVFRFHMAPRCWPVFGSRPRRLRLSRLVVDAVAAWFRDFYRQSPFQRQQCLAALTLCLVEMIRTCDREPGEFDGLDAFRQQLWPLLGRIANEPYAHWSIAKLATEFHLSTPHFSRCFQKVIGQTPKHYLLDTRLQAAAAEIAADPTLPIKTIGERAGYATIHAFAYAFKQFFGTSPGAYRRQVAG